MHPPLLIDWLRKLHLNADAALAAKRWKMAQEFCASVDAEDCIQILRAFLFADPLPQAVKKLTERFLNIDSEFPASNNVEEVRLMAGVVLIAAIEKNKKFATAGALGIRAASFPTHRCSPYENSICLNMAAFLDRKAEELRPSSFNIDRDDALIASAFENEPGSPTETEAMTAKHSGERITLIFKEIYGKRLQRLAEETGILWWMLGGYSVKLGKEIKDLTTEAYALISADEVAERTQILPPPPSIYPILSKILSGCKGFKKKKTMLKDFIVAADEGWRLAFLNSYPTADFSDLVPITTALRKLEDSGDVSSLGKALQKSCPGVSPELATTELEAARQLFDEIIFVRSLTMTA